MKTLKGILSKLTGLVLMFFGGTGLLATFVWYNRVTSTQEVLLHPNDAPTAWWIFFVALVIFFAMIKYGWKALFIEFK